MRIPGFHPGGSGLTAGMGKQVVVFTAIFNNNNNNGNNDNGDDSDNDKDKLLKYFINFNIIQFNTIASLHVCILFFIIISAFHEFACNYGDQETWSTILSLRS